MGLKRGKKTGLKYFDYSDIQSWKPCYTPEKHVGQAWRGTAVDILRMDTVPLADRLWCVLRSEICSERTTRLFAVYCAREALALVKNPDPRSIDAANVAERFANGEATKEELSAAYSAADSAESAAWSAAYSARSAAQSAAWSAAYSADSAAWSAAYSAAQTRQRDKLIEMLVIEGKERNKK